MTRKKGRQLFHFNNLFLFQVFSTSRRQTLPSIGRSVSSIAHSCYKVSVIVIIIVIIVIVMVMIIIIIIFCTLLL